MKNIKKVNWQSPSGVTENQLDYVSTDSQHATVITQVESSRELMEIQTTIWSVLNIDLGLLYTGKIWRKKGGILMWKNKEK